MRKFYYYGIIFLIAVSVIFVGADAYRLAYQPMTRRLDEPVIQLSSSMSASSFVQLLKHRQLIKSDATLLLFIRIQGLSKHLKAGIYQIKAGESAAHFLYRVAEGDVVVETFRITEGTTWRQVERQLAQAPYLHYVESDFEGVSEGSLLADTYHYDAGSNAKQLLNQARENLQQVLTQSFQHRSPDLPYKTPYELLIVASILEKEAATPDERRLISGVIVNRLTKPMRLQMDPTVIYALGEAYHGQLSHQDMQIDSPYNSYRNLGLPPTPIAMVGKDSIDAAAHPERTNFLYFVAKGDGRHQFSITYEQQQKAIAQYLRITQ